MARWQGLVYVALLAGAAWAFGSVTAAWGLGASFVAIVLGMAFGPGPARFAPGIQWAAKPGLLMAIVLLGFQIDVRVLPGSFAKAAAVVTAAMLLAWLLAKPFGLTKPRALLLGAGFGVCGVAAIAATRRSVGADEEDMGYAIPVVAVVGAFLMLALPTLQSVSPMPVEVFGAWVGAVLPAVPQAVGAGYAVGDAAGAAATVMKMSRVAMLPLLVLALSVGGGTGKPRMPIEVLGFMAAVALANLVPLPGALLAGLTLASRVLLVAALVALGCSTRFRTILDAGWRPLALVVVILGATTFIALL